MSTHKVYSVQQRRREVPQIKLQGGRLAAAGFNIGRGIRIHIERGRIIIEPAEAAAARVLAMPHHNPQLAAA